MAGVWIGDDCGPEKIAWVTMVTSSLFGKVAPPLRMDWIGRGRNFADV